MSEDIIATIMRHTFVILIFDLFNVVFVLSRVRQDAFSCVRYVAPRRGGELVAICFRRAREIAKMLDGAGTLLPHIVRGALLNKLCVGTARNRRKKRRSMLALQKVREPVVLNGDAEIAVAQLGVVGDGGCALPKTGSGLVIALCGARSGQRCTLGESGIAARSVHEHV